MDKIFQKVQKLQEALAVERLSGKAPQIVKRLYWNKYVSEEIRKMDAKEATIRLQMAMEVITAFGKRQDFEKWKENAPKAVLPTPWSHIHGREKQEIIIEAAEAAHEAS